MIVQACMIVQVCVMALVWAVTCKSCQGLCTYTTVVAHKHNNRMCIYVIGTHWVKSSYNASSAQKHISKTIADLYFLDSWNFFGTQFNAIVSKMLWLWPWFQWNSTSDTNKTQTHNHSVRKQTLNHLAILHSTMWPYGQFG